MSDTLPTFGHYPDAKPRYDGRLKRHALYVPMRDGVQLAVEVILPASLKGGDKLPAILSQSRYWRATELRRPLKWLTTADQLNPHYKDRAPLFSSHGYALVSVDVRGTGASFGRWDYPWQSETIDDMVELVEWIINQSWSNGRVGGMGTSYLGTTAELLAVCGHPTVKATMPQFNHPDAYADVAFPGGVFNERFIKNWGRLDHALDMNIVPPDFNILGRTFFKGVKPVDGPDGRRLLQAAVDSHQHNNNAYEIAHHVTFRDEIDPETNVSFDALMVHQYQNRLRQNGVSIYGWGSWMDAGTADAVIRRFLTFDKAQRAVIGAWNHGGHFHASPYQSPDAPTSPPLPVQWMEKIRFFDAYLKDEDNGVPSEKVLFYYTLGAETWQKTSVFPPEGTVMERFYMGGTQSLTPSAPQSETGADTFTVDFEATTGTLNRWWELNTLENKTVVYGERREAAAHLLTYTTAPFKADMEITGYPIVTLYVTSTATDGAFYVYLEDMDENGRVTYITEGQLRALHRKVSSPEESPYKLLVPYHTFKQADAMPLVPGEVAELTFGLLPTSVLIMKGHRIRVGIAGHDKGTFVRIPAQGTPTITVQRNTVHASSIDLPVVGRD